MHGHGRTTPLAGSPGEQASAANPGENLVAGKYQLLRVLGEGGMGAVYEARHINTLKRCAVKLLISPELAAHPEVVKRFFREAKASSVVESDHIVQVFDSGSDPVTGHPYMVMELLEGQDLDHLITELGALAPIPAAKIVMQAATGLAKAHEIGVIHRDVKPANLFLCRREDGQITVKLLDFGIAKVKMESFADTSNGLTKTGSMLGTPLYMSPEQARGRTDIDVRADVWSLGVVLFRLLSGELPYVAETLGDLLVAIITGDLPMVQDRAPWVPPELAEIVQRAMSRDIDKRFRNAGELRDALGQLLPDGMLLRQGEIVAVPAEHRAWVAPRLQLTDDGLLRAVTKSGLSVTQTQPPPKKRSMLPVLAGGLGGLALLGFGAVVVTQVIRKEPSPAASAVQPEGPAPSASAVVAPIVDRHALPVSPAGVVVTVDGATAEVKDGRVELVGSLGETRKVRLTAGSREQEWVVAITQSGLVPDELELGSTPTKPPAVTSPTERPLAVKKIEARGDEPAAAKPAGEKPVAQKAPEKPAAPTKPKPAVETSTDEFNK